MESIDKHEVHWHFNKTLHQFLSWVPIPNVKLMIGTTGNDQDNSYHRIRLMYSDPDPSLPVLNLSTLDLTQKLTFCWLWARETFNNLNIIKVTVPWESPFVNRLEAELCPLQSGICQVTLVTNWELFWKIFRGWKKYFYLSF